MICNFEVIGIVDMFHNNDYNILKMNELLEIISISKC